MDFKLDWLPFLINIRILITATVVSLFVGTKIVKKALEQKMRLSREEGARRASTKGARKRWDAVENLLLQVCVLCVYLGLSWNFCNMKQVKHV